MHGAASTFDVTAMKCGATSVPTPRCRASHSRPLCAFASVSCVVNVFDVTMNSVDVGITIGQRARQMLGIDVRHEDTTSGAPRKCSGPAESIADEPRTEIRAADADVDHRPQRPPRGALPPRLAHAARQLGHALARRAHFDRHVEAVDEDCGGRRRAQRGVQHRPVLRQIDLLAREQRRDPVRHIRRIRSGDECVERLGVEAFLGNVDAPVVPFERQRVDTSGIAREQLVQRRRAERTRAGCEIGDARFGACAARSMHSSGVRRNGLHSSRVRRNGRPVRPPMLASPRPKPAHLAGEKHPMNAPDIVDKDLPLREDTRLLGRVLGDVLRAQIGAAGFERVEAIRQTAIGFRRASGAEAGQLRSAFAALLNPLPIGETLEVVRAFSYFSHLANIAEDVHRNRRRRAHAMAGSPPRRRRRRSRTRPDRRRRHRWRDARALARRCAREPRF
jgi:hypothetical protein